MKHNYPRSYNENEARKAEIDRYNQWVKKNFPWYTRWQLYASYWGGFGWGCAGSVITFENTVIVLKIYLENKNSWYIQDLLSVLSTESREVTINWEYAPRG